MSAPPTRRRPRLDTEGGRDGWTAVTIVPRGPVVRAVLRVDVAQFVDELGFLAPRAIEKAIGVPAPEGALVDIVVGDARHIVGHLGQVAALLRPARGVQIIGSDAACTSTIEQALAVAFRRTGAA